MTRLRYHTLLLIISLLLALSASPRNSTAADATDPFAPYLTGEAPVIVEDLGTETRSNGAVSLRQVVFRSRLVGNRESRVYAAIASPSAAGTYPGILVLHGGAGAAEIDKAVGWAARGYIAIAPDLPGIGEPSKMPHSSGPWKDTSYASRHLTALPDASASSIFDGVLAAVQSLYLLRNQNNIDRSKIGVVGLSWGGYTTTMVAGLTGTQVRAAFSIFGSGYYDRGSFWQGALAQQSAQERNNWLTHLDAGRHAKNITASYFVAAATNDTYFWPPAVMATLKDVPGVKNQVFSPNSDHTISLPGDALNWGGARWLGLEYTYFDYYLKGIGALPPVVTVESVTQQTDGSTRVRFRVQSTINIQSTAVYYSTRDQAWKARQWLKIDATMLSAGQYQATIPAGAVTKGADWFALATDTRSVTASTLIIPANTNVQSSTVFVPLCIK